MIEENQCSIVDEQQGSQDRMIPTIEQPHDMFAKYGIQRDIKRKKKLFSVGSIGVIPDETGARPPEPVSPAKLTKKFDSSKISEMRNQRSLTDISSQMIDQLKRQKTTQVLIKDELVKMMLKKKTMVNKPFLSRLVLTK